MLEKSLKIHEPDHFALYVRDLEASVHFYGGVLGLPPLPRPDFPFLGAWFALGTQQLHLITDTMHRKMSGIRFILRFALTMQTRPMLIFSAEVFPWLIPPRFGLTVHYKCSFQTRTAIVWR